MAKNQLRDALIYAQLGMYAFLGSSIILAIGVFVLPLLLLKRLLIAEPLLMIGGGTICTFPSLLLAWLTRHKLITPLKTNQEPTKKSRTTLEILGYFFGLFVGGIMLYIANQKIDSWTLRETATPKN